VAHVRIAKAVNAVTLNHQENLLVPDRAGHLIRANIPSMLLTVEQFPADLKELAV
jgi:hypothetical protein